MSVLKLKQLAVKQVKQGNPLLVEADVLNTQAIRFGQVVDVVDGKTNDFLGRALLGKQNKGIGWMFSTYKNAQLDVPFLKKLFETAKQKRTDFFGASHIDAFRLFNAESDGLGGLTIDIYHQALVVSFYSKGIFEYRTVIFEALHEVMMGYAIFEKCRFTDAPYESQHVSGDTQEQFSVRENSALFHVHMNDGLMTGIFLDQREVRNYVRENTKGKFVLNTFSYTAAFSVAAALGGATETVSVDVAKRSVELSTKQFEVNQLALDNHRFYVMDVFDYFKYAQKKNQIFDWVILDPPSFARTKKRTFSVLKNYTELLEDAIKITAVNGHIIVSTNASNWSRGDVLKMIAQTFVRVNKRYDIVKEFQQPADFTVLNSLEATQYLKVFVIKVLS